MPCDCDQCRQHCMTLGLDLFAPSKAAIRKAYREAAKRWHPDRFEKQPHLRSQAEEKFKQIQAAYEALTKHSATPVALPVEDAVAGPAAPPSTRRPPPPPISFGGAPGCLVGPHFAAPIEKMIAEFRPTLETILAIVDLEGPNSENGGFSQFLLLASEGIMMRDSRQIVSLLWYADLGEIKLVDRRKNGKPSLWQEIADSLHGNRSNYSLQIYRRNGAHFYSVSGPVDDNVKTIIYKFLMRQKIQTHP